VLNNKPHAPGGPQSSGPKPLLAKAKEVKRDQKNQRGKNPHCNKTWITSNKMLQRYRNIAGVMEEVDT